MKIYTPELIGTSSVAGPLTIGGRTIISGSLDLGSGTLFNQINIENANGTNNTVSVDGNSNEIIVIGTANTVNKAQDLVIGSSNNTGYHSNGQANRIIGVNNTLTNGASKSNNLILGITNTISHDGDARTIVGVSHTTAATSNNGGIFAGFGNTLSHDRSVVIGGQSIATAAADTVYVPNFVATGSATIQGNTVISGSVRGEVRALTITSNTASLNCALDNFFTLQLVAGTDTRIEPSNINPGQTINVRINTTGSATVSFPTSVKQASGASYVPTTTTGVDVITLISFDASSLYLANIKNLV